MSLRTPNMRRLRTVLTSILRSSLFLSYTCFGFVLGHCLLRRLLGFSNYWTAALIPGFISCLLSIFLERSSRRTALATYVCTLASESVFNSLKEKGLVSGLRHGNDDSGQRTSLAPPLRRGSSLLLRCLHLPLPVQKRLQKEGGLSQDTEVRLLQISEK